jgi:hypothetical protein
MVRRSLIAAVVFTLLSLPVVSAAEAQSHPIIGTWRLDAAQSSYEPGPAPRGILRRFVEGDDGFIRSVRITAGGQGNPSFAMVRMKFDGRDYPVWTMQGLDAFLSDDTRPPNTAAFAPIDDRTLRLTQKNDGTVGALSPNTWAVSSDGSTLTVTTSGTAADGTVVNNIEVFTRVETENP